MAESAPPCVPSWNSGDGDGAAGPRSMIRCTNSSNSGTVRAVSPWLGLQIIPLREGGSRVLQDISRRSRAAARSTDARKRDRRGRFQSLAGHLGRGPEGGSRVLQDISRRSRAAAGSTNARMRDARKRWVGDPSEALVGSTTTGSEPRLSLASLGLREPGRLVLRWVVR